MNEQTLIPHLFRNEAGKLTAVLCRQFGLAQVETAEDIVHETFLAALETWPYKGVPPNPAAWLYTVAKNKAINLLKRQQHFQKTIVPLLNRNESEEELSLGWSEQVVTGSQLKMLFALCHPSLSPIQQIALSLRLLCGFGIEEIATAFLTNKEVINKRLYRAKETLRLQTISLELPSPKELEKRLDAVLKTLYLLFNEGYYSESNDRLLRKDLCLEAMRLTHLLTGHSITNQPVVNAALSLMCFHASRFEARICSEEGELLLYEEQDATRWNPELIAEGIYYLHKAASGNALSDYHLEAAIAYWHTVKTDSGEKWEAILQLYDQLLRRNPSPIVALNRLYALSHVRGSAEAICEAEKLALENSRFYFALLGNLYSKTDPNKAAAFYEKAILLSRSPLEKRALQKQLLRLHESSL